MRLFIMQRQRQACCVHRLLFTSIIFRWHPVWQISFSGLFLDPLMTQLRILAPNELKLQELVKKSLSLIN